MANLADLLDMIGKNPIPAEEVEQVAKLHITMADGRVFSTDEAIFQVYKGESPEERTEEILSRLAHSTKVGMALISSPDGDQVLVNFLNAATIRVELIEERPLSNLTPNPSVEG